MYRVDVFWSMKWGKEVGISRFLGTKKGPAEITPFLFCNRASSRDYELQRFHMRRKDKVAAGSAII